MTTKATIKQLEKQYNRVTNKGESRIEVIRYTTHNDEPIDKEGYLLSENEIKTIKKEDEEIGNRGGMVLYLTRYCKPKTKIV